VVFEYLVVLTAGYCVSFVYIYKFVFVVGGGGAAGISGNVVWEIAGIWHSDGDDGYDTYDTIEEGLMTTLYLA
jgi:hypothetical protein